MKKVMAKFGKILRVAVVALPFAIALLLNLSAESPHFLYPRSQLRQEHVAGLAFLWATPCGWLPDWLMNNLPVSPRDRWFGYVALLWVPALLYSVVIFSCIKLVPKIPFRGQA